VPRPEEELIAILKNHGTNFTATLPCEKIKTLLEMVARDFTHVPLTREEEGVGICAGASLAGKRPALFVQSSGIGNMINALLSLTQFYELPLALFVSRRGVYQEKIEAQLPMGQHLPGILSGAGISCSEINGRQDFNTVDRELGEVFKTSKIHAFLLSPAVWVGSECKIASSDFTVQSSVCKEKSPAAAKTFGKPEFTRYDIIRIIAPYLAGKAVVSNLGWPSKELYALKHQPSNFYMLGSMGMATPIGLGIALTAKKEVIVIDGDGSLLMNPGTLATAAYTQPENLTIIAIDNGAYGSTGNQPTLTSSCVDLEQVAHGFGFQVTAKVASEKEIVEVMDQHLTGPAFIHVLAVPGNKDVTNIPVHHGAIKKQVQEFLKR
jgi:sulfopyruvate decarboxylase beta subunit